MHCFNASSGVRWSKVDFAHPLEKFKKILLLSGGVCAILIVSADNGSHGATVHSGNKSGRAASVLYIVYTPSARINSHGSGRRLYFPFRLGGYRSTEHGAAAESRVCEILPLGKQAPDVVHARENFSPCPRNETRHGSTGGRMGKFAVDFLYGG